MDQHRTFLMSLALGLALAINSSAARGSAYNDAVLASNPLYYWTFDEASGNAIDQVNGLAADELTPQGGATRTTSTTTVNGISLGNAASFAQNGQFAVSDLSGTTILDLYAMEFWVRATSGGGVVNQYVMSVGVNTPAVLYGYNAGVLEFYSPDGRSGAGGPNIADADWYHVVIGVDRGAQTHRIIINDGTPLDFTQSSQVYGMPQLDLYVGAVTNVGHFGGNVDELALYDLSGAGDFNAALSGIANHYNAAIPEPATAGLLLLGAMGALARRRN